MFSLINALLERDVIHSTEIHHPVYFYAYSHILLFCIFSLWSRFFSNSVGCEILLYVHI